MSSGREKLRERLSREQGTIVKDWGGRLPVALIYPNSYYIGMSSLGVQAVYGLLNGYSEVVCERAFWEQEAPLSVESRRPLGDFAVLAFSVSYELDYFNLVQVLKSSGIPLKAAERDERHPLVIAGGPCITANPVPLSPFFDCLCIGEAEPIIPAILDSLREGIGAPRHEVLKALSRINGIYVPGYSTAPVARQWARDLDEHDITSVVLTHDTELGDLYLIEVERGCVWGCRFCLVCSAFSPMRLHSADRLVEQARRGLGYRRRIGLVGAAVTDHPHIQEIMSRIRGMGAQLSISSLRLSTLSSDILEEMARGGVHNVALAPEAGSERLRGVIKKTLREPEILDAIGRAAEHGMRQLKLYFMIGLPSETDDDMREIVRLTAAAKGEIERRRAGTRLTLNISSFVPKAGTPFQWLGMAPTGILSDRLAFLRRELASRGVKAKFESPAWSEVQAVLARGNVGAGDVLADMKEFTLAEWRRAVEKYGLDTDFYAHGMWDAGQELPWSMIDSGISRARLKGELNKAIGGFSL